MTAAAASPAAAAPAPAPAAPAPAEIREGVTLAQLAAVQAAIAAGLPLDDALAAEGVAGVDWVVAERAWTEAIAADDALAADLDDAFALAAARHARIVPPLDDLPTFVAVVQDLARQEGPIAWLAQRGLRLEDVTAALGHWTRRMKADPAVALQLETLFRTPTPPVTLTASPVPRQLAGAAPSARPPAPEAAAESEAGAGPPAFADLPLPDEPSDPDGGANEALVDDALGARPALDDAPRAGPAPVRVVEAAAPALQVPSFMRQPAPPAAPTAGAPALRRSRLGATMMGVLLPPAAALPFAPARPAARPSPGTMMLTADDVPPPPPAAGELERYADLCFELGQKREPVDVTLRRHHLTTEAKAELDAVWERRFAADAALRMQWLARLVERRKQLGG